LDFPELLLILLLLVPNFGIYFNIVAIKYFLDYGNCWGRNSSL